ncbi:hypothetical protein [Bradyrhizobium sp. Tv2a-2]|uniref:hypothetical protein n=1 Tax=Bradyrhizobium sp. Tv2a-2 TaxID=113395 RepID=UPI0004674B32|nr:hypothetical protein [Bradyrhizobium sp. Tv2a-2]
MYLKKSALPVAPATSSGLPVDPTLDTCGGVLSASILSPTDTGPTRNRDLQPSQAKEDFRNETRVSNALLMKAAAERKQHAYLVPYARLREVFGFERDDGQLVALSSDRIEQAVRMMLRAVHVDEDWYLRHYPDVKAALAQGVFRSAKHHFIESGYFEGRKPARVIVDEAWYARAYPDVSESVEFGELGSCQEHFDRYGEREGRLPSED